MRVPRQWSGADLKKALAVLGYEETRQKIFAKFGFEKVDQEGSHVKIRRQPLAGDSAPFIIAA